jgi:hypothetical protein
MEQIDTWLGILLLLALFEIKHFIADFVIQRARHFTNKGSYGNWGGIEHALQHGVLTWAVLFFFTTPAFALMLGLFDALVHYHVDWFKTKYGPKDNTKTAYWVWFGADQLLHQLTYITILYFVVLVFSQ